MAPVSVNHESSLSENNLSVAVRLLYRSPRLTLSENDIRSRVAPKSKSCRVVVEIEFGRINNPRIIIRTERVYCVIG
ncbi:MAG: hypothetical protein A07HR60_01779 [uncultured archaeon A07HR60]|nr:MAG: hypothetical protein A07HR60_01779 [uncultured archaeon A07HR60]